MLPILFTIGPAKIYTLGFFLMIGFFVAAFIFWRRLISAGYKEEKIIDLIIFESVLALINGRLFYIFQNFHAFAFLPDRWLFWARYPGFSFWGGVTGLYFALFYFTRKEKWLFWQIADEMVYAILPLLALVQFGCFFDGASPGKSTSYPWGIYFPGNLLKQQPVSLFFGVLLFILWLFLRRIERQWRIWSWYKSKAEGFVTLIFWIFLFGFNFLLAFLRESRLYFYWLEVILSLLVFSAICILFYRQSGRNIKEDLWKKKMPKRA